MALLKVMVGGQIAALGRAGDSLEFDASKCTLTSQNMALKLSFSLFALFILSSLAARHVLCFGCCRPTNRLSARALSSGLYSRQRARSDWFSAMLKPESNRADERSAGTIH